MNDWRRYDPVAEAYERVRAPLTRVVAADLVAFAAPAQGARVLDVGTGTGVAAEAAEAAVGSAGLVVGADQSVGMLRVAHEARAGLALVAAEAIQLPFRDSTFDAVTANFVLHEFTRYDTALFDLIRVLRPGGRLASSTWAVGEDALGRTWRELIQETIGPEMVRSTLRDAHPWAERFGRPDALEQTLRDAGLRPVRIERRAYRFSLGRDDYVTEQSARALGRFVREMLGPKGWDGFLERARRTFAASFPDQIRDTRDVLLAVGTKP